MIALFRMFRIKSGGFFRECFLVYGADESEIHNPRLVGSVHEDIDGIITRGLTLPSIMGNIFFKPNLAAKNPPSNPPQVSARMPNVP